MSRKGRRSGPKRSYTGFMIIAVLVALAVVAYYIFTQSGITGGSPLIGQPVSQTVLSELAGVNQQVLTFVGPGAAGTTSITSTATPLNLDGKPEVLYMGAEYCPYCATERWALIVALDKFGTFSGLEYMQSAPSPEADPLTSTFTFVHANYTSSYLAFVPVEMQDRAHNQLESATASQTSLQQTYDSTGSIPFVDVANKYVLTFTQVSPAVFRVGGSDSGAPYNWTQIGSQLNNATSSFATNVDGAANRLIAAFCKVDNNQPTSVCSSSALTVSYHPGALGWQPQASEAVLNLPTSSTARPVLTRFARL